MLDRDQALSHYWDGLVLGVSAAETGGDETLFETVEYLDSIRGLPVPAAAAERIAQRIAPLVAAPPVSGNGGVVLEGPWAPIPLPGQVDRRSGFNAHQVRYAAIAAGLLIFMLAGAALLGSRLLNNGDESRQMPAFAPAVDISPLLLDGTLAGDVDHPLGAPGSVLFDADGNTWVLDLTHDNFQIYNQAGDFVETWGSSGSEPGQFDFGSPIFPNGGAVFDAAGNLYVADSMNHRIQKFGPDRQFLLAWGSEGKSFGEFQKLNDVVIDEQGRIFALDSEQSIVQVFDNKGTFLYQFHVLDGNGYRIEGPADIELGTDDAVWIVKCCGIVRYTLEGKFLSHSDETHGERGFYSPSGVAFDSEGRFYVAEGALRGYLEILGPEWQRLASTDGELDAGFPYLGDPFRIAIDPAGAIYVGDWTGKEYRVQKLTLNPEYWPDG